MKKRFFSEDFEELLKKSMLGYSPEAFFRIAIASSFLISVSFGFFSFLIWTRLKFPAYYIGIVFLASAFFSYKLVTSIPVFALAGRKAVLESDLLYSARHLILKLESGSSLVNSLESVSTLNTNSSRYFKALIFDISLGVPVEAAVEKAIEYSPSKAYTKIMEEIISSLKTGSDIQKTLKSTLGDITKQHLIQIQEYGKKLNPMSMFYMILGTIIPSLGTAMLVVASSFMPGALIIDFRILMAIAFLLLVVQIFFILAFKSLKPAVMG